MRTEIFEYVIDQFLSLNGNIWTGTENADLYLKLVEMHGEELANIQGIYCYKSKSIWIQETSQPVLAHELGHFLDAWVTGHQGFSSDNKKYFPFNSFRADWLRIKGRAAKRIDRIHYNHMVDNPQELFADCFMLYIYGRDLSPQTTLYIEEILIALTTNEEKEAI